MKFLTITQMIAIITNTTFIGALILGQMIVFKFTKLAKLAAYYSIFIIVLLLLYVLSFSTLFFLYLFKLQLVNALLSVLFLVSPFVIGHFCSYPKIALYTWVQIVIAILSLLFLMKISAIV